MTERHRRVMLRAVPAVLLASGAFIGGVVVAGDPAAPAAQRFLDAWERDDISAMYAEISLQAKADYPMEKFERAYRDAADTATISALTVGEVLERDESASALISIDTHAFGDVQGELELPLAEDAVAWEPHHVYPGLAAGEQLVRRTRAARRAPILAADRSPLAQGPAVARSVETPAAAVVGEVGEPTAAQAEELTRRGFPPGTPTGTSGLELAWNERLAGEAGGQLLAVTAAEQSEVGGGRPLASSAPVAGKAVRTTIDPAVQEAAVSALGSLYGGVAAVDADDGSVLALSGLAYSAPQPPGSTFKLITTVGALDAGIVAPGDEFPVEISNSEIGREIANSHDSPCGGTFVESFASSCNTVFAPLGVELGGEALVETAESFGFNSLPSLFDGRATTAMAPPPSTIPEQLSSSVEVGESAIGQGQVLATPLQMASVAQTIANGGIREPTAIARTPELRPKAEPVKVTSEQTAATLRDLMVEVVDSGTGVAAAIPGVQVAGKTGTAELGPKALEPGVELEPGEDPPQELDAWFTAFAPAGDPKLAVAVMVVDADGDGGEIAAPIARQVLEAGLAAG